MNESIDEHRRDKSRDDENAERTYDERAERYGLPTDAEVSATSRPTLNETMPTKFELEAFMTDAELLLANVRAASFSMKCARRDLQEANKSADPILSMLLLPAIADASSLANRLMQLVAAIQEKRQ